MVSNSKQGGLAGAVALSATAWGAGLVLHSILRLFLPTLMPPGPMLFVSSVLCMAAAFASVALLLRAKVSGRLAMLLVGCAIAANLLANLLIPDPAARLVVGYSLIVLGFGLGSLLAGFVDSPRYLLPVCVVAAVADLWSVWAGPTRAIVDARSEIVQRHTFVAVPVAEAAQSQPIAGIGDVIFVALLLCIAARLGLPLVRAIAYTTLFRSPCGCGGSVRRCSGAAVHRRRFRRSHMETNPPRQDGDSYHRRLHRRTLGSLRLGNTAESVANCRNRELREFARIV